MPVFSVLDPKRHDRARFTCGEPSLDRYIREQAAQHHRDGIATTHVLTFYAASADILGFYALSAAQVLLSDLQESDRRRLPAYPVPAVRLGRLAVAVTEQGKGHGALLLAHAVDSCLDLRQRLGIRVLIVDALNANAAAFYAAFGFRSTTENSMVLYLPLGRTG